MQPPIKCLQVAVWDANLVTPHKRMGNASISLESLCDGNLHELLVELEGMGGGGQLQLEVKYKTFDEIEDSKKRWKLPFVSEFLRINGLDSALEKVIGSKTVRARQFVEYSFGQLKSFNESYLSKGRISDNEKYKTRGSGNSDDSAIRSDMSLQMESSLESSLQDTGYGEQGKLEEFQTRNGNVDDEHASEPLTQVSKQEQSDKFFWKNFASVVNQNIAQKLGLSVPEKLKWDGFDLLNKIGLQSRKIAEAGYIESGLATPEDTDGAYDKTNGPLAISAIESSLPDIKKATQNLMRQTDSVLGALMLVTAAVSQLNKEDRPVRKSEIKEEDSTKAEEMKSLFSTAESAMEAWAMLATSMGHPSFIKSEFEKICFLDNASTDTQVAIWRDSGRRRLVVAFRGTEQARWKDLITDLMLVPAGLNPERIGGDFKQEVQVFRTRIISLIRLAIGYLDDNAELLLKWHIYVTGHSLGGALATLLALELSSSQLAKRGAISLTMYNFGSPRVGNRRFAEVYNENVRDSWRVVNHRDIIPTVPRLMGYCHVAEPVYLAAGEVKNALVGNWFSASYIGQWKTIEILEDGYQGDVIGESTPDVLVSEFMKGEKELVEKILQTEINIFLSIRDGSALMQHMEDFYYISLLENVRSNYQIAARPQSNEQEALSKS
ncbi:Fungal lipase-like [Quillaja saponaria]|uniref:Fungal lipase-like n=1 Tax=Quillaja saponaria TaxID=32244 RepID=A0AAD7PH99_QUISA|nr:Fungal lipase-like [Quillaja saponaria]